MKPNGASMDESDWSEGFAKSITIFLNGDQIDGTDEQGERITDDSFLVLFNAHYEQLAFRFPTSISEAAGKWFLIPQLASSNAVNRRALLKPG